MCGIAGMVNLKANIKDRQSNLTAMTDTLKMRGPDSHGVFISSHALLGHRRLVVVDPSGGAQPMERTINGKKYVIVYNGELYNTEDVRKELLNLGFSFKAYSDTEVLLTAYIAWKEDCVKHINGIYAFGIWDENSNKLFLCRDPLGVKPLFYTVTNNTIIFGSEIKTILASSLVEPVLDEEGLCEIFGLSPAKRLDSGTFKGIKQLPPACFLIYDQSGLRIKEYWQLVSKPHTEDPESTAEHTRNLLIDAIKRQLVADVPVCTFLSGGLDSSIISAIASSEFKKDGKILDTYSIEYKDNSLYFKASEFQPNSDEEWVEKMHQFLGSNHHRIIIDHPELVKSLEAATMGNDVPAMADIDSSLLLFCKEIRKNATVALSGECAYSLRYIIVSL
ncbi:MAG: asparagine synthase (glutamine-hydrolyzing) [Bacillota bacterium]|nr:asparagine synthase (glutamine-hydrolyzing) [Bacillota bacterium]